jgi:RimJ/RimL family protein N-acetyltransferase/nucleotide-binding universal stress UspA family protein
VTRAGGTRLRDGSWVEIRPIQREDRELLRSGFDRLSDRTRYLRFHAPVVELSDQQLSYLTDVDHHDHEALIAVDPVTGEVVGVARFVRVGDAVAECAIAVADDWQGRGIGTELLDRLVERAREERVERFTALVLAENAEAIHLLERLGDTVQRTVGPQTELDIALPEPAHTSPQMRTVLAAAARGLLIPAISTWRQVADFTHRRAPAPAEPANAIVVHAFRSDGTAPALDIAADLAARHGAGLHLVESYWPLPWAREEMSRELTGEADGLRRRGIDVTHHLLAAETVDAVIDVAEQTRAGLIVIDPRAASPVMPWRAYSLPARLCARAPCDVLIARAPAARPADGGRSRRAMP